MTKFSRYIECALGILFILSAGMKAMNVDGFGVSISAYGVIKDPSLVRMVAYASLAIEAILGTALIAGWRVKNLSFIVSILLTTMFSALILYAWKVKGLEDCGCFGDYIKMNPPQSLAKNAVIIGCAALAGYGLRDAKDAVFRPKFPAQVAGVLGGVIVLLVTIFLNEPVSLITPSSPDKDIAFVVGVGEKAVDLGTGEYLIAFLNTGCSHCKESVPGLNTLSIDTSLPPFIALMMGDEDSLDDFLIETEAAFTMELLDELSFMQFIKTAPPILYHSTDGMIQHHWEWEDEPPTPDTIKQDILTQKE